MKAVGLVTEYNPFHNGHLHHLKESLRVTGAEASVAVMSGHFLQRGEPALVDKWVRTGMALAAGVDLVLELPFPFACNSAPHFALGAVRSLAALGVVDALCFGSEAGELRALEQVTAVLEEKAEAVEAETARRLRQGVNYPAARAEVLAELLPEASVDQLASPNNILGIEYLRALRRSEGRITPFTIKRLGAGYHDTEVVGAIASATGIRRKLEKDEAVGGLLPEPCAALLDQALREGRCLDGGKLFVALQALLLQEPALLEDVYLVGDGLERRLNLAAMEADDFAGLARQVKSRQWTLTRIQRILIYVLLQIRSAEMRAFLESGPLYLRLLGATERGRRLLAMARKRKSLPLIADPARAQGTLRRFYQGDAARARLAERMLACDLRATRLYGLLQKAPREGHRNRDFFMSVLEG